MYIYKLTQIVHSLHEVLLHLTVSVCWLSVYICFSVCLCVWTECWSLNSLHRGTCKCRELDEAVNTFVVFTAYKQSFGGSSLSQQGDHCGAEIPE